MPRACSNEQGRSVRCGICVPFVSFKTLPLHLTELLGAGDNLQHLDSRTTPYSTHLSTMRKISQVTKHATLFVCTPFAGLVALIPRVRAYEGEYPFENLRRKLGDESSRSVSRRKRRWCEGTSWQEFPWNIVLTPLFLVLILAPEWKSHDGR